MISVAIMNITNMAAFFIGLNVIVTDIMSKYAAIYSQHCSTLRASFS